MPPKKGSNRQQWNAGFMKPDLKEGIQAYIKRTRVRAGELTDTMWREYCEKRGLDPTTGQ